MKFINCTLDRSISLAIADAEKLLGASSYMMNRIWKKDDWKYDDVDGYGAVVKLCRSYDPLHVYHYTSWNPFSKAMGYYNGEDEIHINKRKTFTHAEMVGLLLHEYAHHCGFTHGNNYKTQEKCMYSVPYYLSENVEVWLKGAAVVV